jgi:proline dehydrogenase
LPIHANELGLRMFMKKTGVSFDNTEIAFAGKTDNDLNRAYWLFKLIHYNWLVKISPPFVQFALWAKIPIKGIIKDTVFKHFCGGENIEDCRRTIDELGRYNIGTILDYSVEGKETEEDFDGGLSQTLSTIEEATKNPNVPFSVFKPTGFARFSLLEKINEKKKLTVEEQKEFERFRNRVQTICRTGFENNVPIYIDAEQSWIQDGIDDLVREMMMMYNKDKVVIYNTIQMYRTDRLEFLKQSHEHARKNNYKIGMKIVRGAYMEIERKRASQYVYQSPVHPNKEATDKSFDDALRFCVEHIDDIAICCGTHNEQSCTLLTELMLERNLPHNHPHIWFSQLYGMSNHISYNLARADYNVSKYVPYGPVTSVLPYLIRRAQENTSVKGQTGRELSLILAEKKRRKSNY